MFFSKFVLIVYAFFYVILNITYYEVESVLTEINNEVQQLEAGWDGAGIPITPEHSPPAPDGEMDISINDCVDEIKNNFNGKSTAIECFIETLYTFDKSNVMDPEYFNYKYMRYFRFLGIHIDVSRVILPIPFCQTQYIISITSYYTCLNILYLAGFSANYSRQQIFNNFHFNYIHRDFAPDDNGDNIEIPVKNKILQELFNMFEDKLVLNVGIEHAIDPMPWCELHHDDDSEEDNSL